MAEPKQELKERPKRFHLNLAGLKHGEERPEITVTLLDRQGKPLHVAHVDAAGGFDLPDSALKETQRVVIGPRAQEGTAVDPETLLRYRLSDFEQLAKAGALNIARPVWQKWLLFIQCVTGTVKLCRFSPPWFQDLFRLATALPSEARLARAAPSVSLRAAAVNQISPAVSVSELINFPFFRCQIICNGTVEVYRRTCCCNPWIIEDPRLPELIRELEKIIHEIEQAGPIPVNPNPPDPAPLVARVFFKDGALDERALNAHADLAALSALPKAEIAAYVNARPYLRCFTTCGTSHKVAQGAIHPDGRFNLCWLDWPRLHLPNCHDEFAYVVKQRFGPFTFTIYDGIAANIWFSASDDASLVSYSALAYACRNNGDPGDGAYVFLDVIGDTESWNLKTPDATAWDSVAAPAYNDGLVFPSATPAAAVGANLNRNWGGTLKLNYKFSEDLKLAPVGAIYYRISITAADGGGAPVGPRYYLSAGLSWEKSEPDGMGGVNIVPVVLGPFTVGTQDNLFKIPYDSDADWNADQYHGFLDTTDPRWSDPTVRHLVTVEVFDSAGTRLRPNGAPASTAGGAESAAPFTFRRRFQDIGPTNPVPFAALTHMFWWDNRPLDAEILYLNKDGLVFSEECLFLLGTAASTFGIGYRAYHPNEMFQLAHSISWQRGLGTFPGATGYLLPSASDNVGQPPALPGNSPTNTFAQMLRTDLDPTRKKCAFTVFLSISSKTTDGDYLGNGGITTTAAFAIEIN